MRLESRIAGERSEIDRVAEMYEKAVDEYAIVLEDAHYYRDEYSCIVSEYEQLEHAMAATPAPSVSGTVHRGQMLDIILRNQFFLSLRHVSSSNMLMHVCKSVIRRNQPVTQIVIVLIRMSEVMQVRAREGQ